MIVSARSALIVLVGIVPLALSPSRAFAWTWFGLVIAACLIDTAGAPSPRTLRLRRDVTGPIRADQTTTATLRLTNTTKRHMTLDVRDAWPPSRRANACASPPAAPPPSQRRSARRGGARATPM